MTLTARDRRRNLVAVMASLAVASLIHGLTLPLLSLVLNKAGVDPTLIGLSAAAQYLSVFVVAPFTARLLGSVGPVKLMLWSTLSTAVLFIMLPLYIDFLAWFVLRFLIGIALSFLWISGEALINHVAEEHTRGRVVAVYTMVAAGGFALGPIVLTLTGSDGWLPFVIATVLMALAAGPMWLVTDDAPRIEGRPSASLPRYVLLAPVSMFVYLAFSAADSLLLTLLPLYALQAGLSEAVGVSLLTVMAVGAIACQPPVGWLADRFDRRLLTVALLLLLLASSTSLPFVIESTPYNAVFMFMFGGGLGGLYTVSMVLLGERFKGGDLSAAATVFSTMFCLGAMISPAIGGFGLERLGGHGVPVVLGTIFLLSLALPMLSWHRQRRAP